MFFQNRRFKIKKTLGSTDFIDILVYHSYIRIEPLMLANEVDWFADIVEVKI